MKKRKALTRLGLFKPKTKELLSKDEEAAAYYVALLWSKLMMKVKGDWLCRQEKELWKMGYDISGRASVRPVLVASNTQNTRFHWTLAEKGAFWFPHDKRRYKKLWDIMSCGKKSYIDLVQDVENNRRDELDQMVDDMASIYGYLIDFEDEENLPKLPPKMLGSVLAERWAKHIVEQTNADILLESYFSGVPVGHITAG